MRLDTDRIDYETYDLDYVTTVAKRFHKKGYKIYLDYHFSDYWVSTRPEYSVQQICTCH